MRNLIFISLLFVSALSFSQGLVPGIVASSYTATPTGVDSANWEQEYKDYYYEIAEAGRPGIDTADKQNDFIDSMVTNGYWARIDLAYLFAQKTESGALLDLINPGGSFDAANDSATLFTSYEGFTGDGASDYLDTKWDASNNGSNFTVNDASMGVYVRTYTSSTNQTLAGVNDGSRDNYISRNGGSFYNRVNSAGSIVVSNTDAGLVITTRRASDDVELYMNGSSIGTDTDASDIVSANDLYILARNDITSSAYWSEEQVSFFFISDQLSDTEVDDINTFIETYMDYIGAGVQ